MKTSKKLLAFAICLVMLATLVPMAAFAEGEATLSITSVTVTDPVDNDGLKTVTVVYNASNVEQVTILGMVGGTEAASTYDNTTIAYIDQQAAATNITVDSAPVTGFQFVVDENKFSETNNKIFIKMGGTALGAAVNADPEVIVDAVVILYGDVNGDGNINSTDAGLILQYYVGKITTFPGANGAVAANVNGDSNINSTDAGLILQYYVGKISIFPVQEAN